jgi:hypothetical protein
MHRTSRHASLESGAPAGCRILVVAPTVVVDRPEWWTAVPVISISCPCLSQAASSVHYVESTSGQSSQVRILATWRHCRQVCRATFGCVLGTRRVLADVCAEQC